MNTKPTEAIETIKKEAKEYYKWKNMTPRYIVIFFLLIVILLQFILPKSKINFLGNETKNETWSTNIIGVENTNILGGSIILKEKDIFFNINFQKSLAKILDKKYELEFIYKLNKSILDELETELKKEKIPNEFKYMLLLSDKSETILPISLEAEDLYELRVNWQINERLNYNKSLDVFIEYINLLYNDFKDRDLVMIGYFMWSENLKSLMMIQDQTDFEKLYLEKDILEKYFDIIAYQYVFNNISKYLDIKNITVFDYPKTSKIKIWETKDILKWAEKAGYSFKSIKELNPWILWNSLPKWKREITVER